MDTTAKIDRLGEEIGELSAHLDSATQRLLTCIRTFDEAGGWHRQGAVSCAHWLSWRVGLDPATAREKVRVAHALGELPQIDQALGRGELSYAKVRALTRVATPQNEPQLLDIARHATAAQLERICRGYRVALRSNGPQEPTPDRWFHKRHLDSGMVKLEIILTADEAALVETAIQKARDSLRSRSPDAPAEPPLPRALPALPPPPHRALPPTIPPNVVADILSDADEGEWLPVQKDYSTESFDNPEDRPRYVPETLRQFFACRAADEARKAGGASTAAPPASPRHPERTPINQPAPVLPTPADVSAEASSPAPVRRRPATPASAVDALLLIAESYLAQPDDPTASATAAARSTSRYQIFVHLDQEVLAPDGHWSATLDDGSRLPAETLRRIACDAGLSPTLTDATGAVLDVGRRTRTINPALRRALWLRDRGCRFPSCSHTRFLHAHHIHHWLHGGRTNLENLVLLCSHHHRVVHEEGYKIVPATGDHGVMFQAPSGQHLPAVPAPIPIGDAVDALEQWAAAESVEIDGDTNAPRGSSGTPDYEWIVGGLMPERLRGSGGGVAV